MVLWVTRDGTGLARSLKRQAHQPSRPTTSSVISVTMISVYQLNQWMYSITSVAGCLEVHLPVERRRPGAPEPTPGPDIVSQVRAAISLAATAMDPYLRLARSSAAGCSHPAWHRRAHRRPLAPE